MSLKYNIHIADKTRANKKLAPRNTITIMLIIVIFFFLMFIIPEAIMSAFFRFGYAEAEDNRPPIINNFCGKLANNRQHIQPI